MVSPPTDSADLPKKGDLIAGKYQVEDVLGKGGMGVVVAARHVVLRQRVAIKFLLPAGMRLPGARERFLREAQAAAAIQSEHVARVLDVGTLETGTPYMVMEHLSGTDLGLLLKTRKQLSIPEAVDFVLQALEAIAEAHALGIVHRDLKPQNLFLVSSVGGAPLIKVLDFGLAKMESEPGDAPEASLTATDLVVGSPHYMSPEQVRSLKHTDARTDIWALGVILYQLITGRRPFDGDSLTAICASIAADPPYPLQTYRPDTPAALDALVRRCLEKDPTHRVPSATALAHGLAPFRSPHVIPYVEPGTETLPVPVPSPPAPAAAAAAPAPAALSAHDPMTAQLSAWGRTQGQPRQAVRPIAAAALAASIVGVLAASSFVGFRAGGATTAAAKGAASTSPPAALATTPERTEATTPERTEATTPERTGATAPKRTEATAPERTETSQAVMPAVPVSRKAASLDAPRPAAIAAPIAQQADAGVSPPAKAAPEPPAPSATTAAISKPSAEEAPRPKPTEDMFQRW